MNQFVYLIIFAVSALLLLTAVQGRPSFLLLLPIILLSVGIGWFLNKQIQKEHEENIKKGFTYTKEEVDAEHWLHQTFIPKTKLLFKKHIKEAIIYSGLILLAFIFAWSYFVAGLLNALIDVGIAFILYSIFVFYILHADKWYRFIFKHIPRQYRSLKNNDWMHAYIILLPFAFVCFLFYMIFNYSGDIFTSLIGIPIFLFVFTLAFIFSYCARIIYRQYKADEDDRTEDTVKKILEK